MPTCRAILKSGKRKGQMCLAKTTSNYCGRHPQFKPLPSLLKDKAGCGCGAWPVQSYKAR